jgi:hypothetical protein
LRGALGRSNFNFVVMSVARLAVVVSQRPTTVFIGALLACASFYVSMMLIQSPQSSNDLKPASLSFEATMFSSDLNHGNESDETPMDAYAWIQKFAPLALILENAYHDPSLERSNVGSAFEWNEKFIVSGAQQVHVDDEWLQFKEIPRDLACEESTALCAALKFEDLQEKKLISGTKIPQLIHQTWDVIPQGGAYLTDMQTFKELNPEAVHIFWEDRDVVAFVKFCFPQLFRFFQILSYQAMKADLFRYLVVYRFGGLYTDVDTKCLQPFDEWITDRNQKEFNLNGKIVHSSWVDKIQIILALENDFLKREKVSPGNSPEKLGITHPGGIVQWTFAGVARHELLKDASLKAIQNLMYFLSLTPDSQLQLEDKMQNAMIPKLSGPGMFSQVVYQHIHDRTDNTICWRDFSDLEEAVTIGEDMRILSITAFAPSLGMPSKMGSQPSHDRRALVLHRFRNSWRRT